MIGLNCTACGAPGLHVLQAAAGPALACELCDHMNDIFQKANPMKEPNDWRLMKTTPVQQPPPIQGTLGGAEEDKGTPTPGVSAARVESVIAEEEYAYSGVLTVCVLTLKNGFKVTGESACVRPEDYDRSMGEDIARKKAIEKVWALEGYLLREKLHRDAQPEPYEYAGAGWLIEWSPGYNGTPLYLKSRLGVVPCCTANHEEGLRFAREDDALTFMAMEPELCFGARATEHMWVKPT